MAQLQLVYGWSALFRASSRQDPDDAQKIIAERSTKTGWVCRTEITTPGKTPSRRKLANDTYRVQKIFEL